jgi:hypothetical protein
MTAAASAEGGLAAEKGEGVSTLRRKNSGGRGIIKVTGASAPLYCLGQLHNDG